MEKSNSDRRSILDHPIMDLGVSENFIADFERAGFKILRESLAFEADDLVRNKKFSYHTITELIELLSKHDLLHLFKD